VPPHIIEKYREEAKAKGKESFVFAWVMDSLKEERDRGITIDVGASEIRYRKILFYHRGLSRTQGFVKNMITALTG